MKNRMLIAAALVSLCFAGCGGSNQKEPESADGPMENAGEAVTGMILRAVRSAQFK